MAVITQSRHAIFGRRYGSFAGKGGAETYVVFGDIQLYTDGNWSGSVFVFQGTLRASSGTALARVWDKTAAAPVAGSGISSASSIDERVRSGTITLVNGHEYQAQVAKTVGSTAYAKSCRLIGIPA